MALSCNTKLVFPSPAVSQNTFEKMNAKRALKPGEMKGVSSWPALMRKLEKMDPSFKD
jgi:hypothetical protein